MKTLSEVLARPKYQAAWIKRLGALSFLFFFIKGLVWVALPFFIFMD